MRLVPLLLLTVLLAAAEPVAPSGSVDLHGTLWQPGQDQPAAFWARLLPPNKAYAGQRMLQLVYTPPPPTALAGTVLVDHPFLLVDGALRLVAWNGRGGLAQITSLTAGGYRVVREIISGEGIAARGEEDVRTLGAAPAWDLRLAPLLLALAWTPDSTAEVPLLDFYGDLPAASLRWSGTAVVLGDTTATVEPGPAGRLARLVASDGRVLVARAAP
jgi:hypothetical protein